MNRRRRWTQKDETILERIRNGTCTTADLERAERMINLIEEMRLQAEVKEKHPRTPRRWPRKP